MAAAGRWEPYELRGSRTVLGARGGENPPRDSLAALHLLRPSSAGSQAAAVQHRWLGRGGRGGGTDRDADPAPLAANAYFAARRFRLRPRDADDVVRDEPCGLPVRPGTQRTIGDGDQG